MIHIDVGDIVLFEGKIGVVLTKKNSKLLVLARRQLFELFESEVVKKI